jgi:hypothetical protein
MRLYCPAEHFDDVVRFVQAPVDEAKAFRATG